MSEEYSFTDQEEDVSDSNLVNTEFNFKENEQELENNHEDQTPMILLNTELSLEPQVLTYQIDENSGEVEDYQEEYIDSEENYGVLEIDGEGAIEGEYIDELEEGEIRDGNIYDAYDGLKCLNNVTGVLFECSVCQRTFSQKGNLLRHYQTHTGDKPFACRLCGHKFTQKSNLQKHLATHNGDKNFECGLCQKGFVQKANLIRHLRIHTGEKPFQCDLCGHKFTQKGNLNKHMQLHSSSTETVCEYCDCRFGSYTARMRHETNVHHKKASDYDEDESPNDNRCDECPASFRTKLALRKHKKFHK